jgi:RNA polymerase sigma-70 factor (ECF subfamily)
MEAGRPRFAVDRRARDELADRFFRAMQDGDVAGLRDVLAADVHLIGDGGGKVPQWSRGITGVGNVARVLAMMNVQYLPIGVTVEPQLINGQPGAMIRDCAGKVLSTWTLDVVDGRIRTIRAQMNPDKLRHLGPVADAWAILREGAQARTRTGSSES